MQLIRSVRRTEKERADWSGQVKRITARNFRSDTLYPRVSRAIADLMRQRKPISAAAVFIQMGMLRETDFQAWRAGQVPYLERVIHGSLGKASRVLRILAHDARERGLVPVLAHYRGVGRARVVPLRFSKSGERALEEAYRRHFVPPVPWEVGEEHQQT